MSSSFETLCKKAELEKAQKGAETTLSNLAKLNSFEYANQRKETAASLGVSVTVLDKEVRKRQAKAEQDDTELPHWKVDPHPEPVDGAKLLDDIKEMFCRYIVLPKGAPEAIALWTLHAWTMDAGDVSPFLVLASPTKRCGKTNTMTILLYLTPRSELASNISPSAVYRYIEETRPTLLIDEGDAFLKENEEMRGILNSGHTRSAANVIRNVEVNGEHKPRRFSTWAAKAIATIGKLSGTLEDRGIIVPLQRKPPTAKVQRLRLRDNPEFAALRSRAARWAQDNFNNLSDPDPKVPEALNDRAADNWRPLLAIADLAGGAWPKKAQAAALLLSGEAASADDDLGVDLLRDIKASFESRGADVLFTKSIIVDLVANEERPWATYGRGQAISGRQLARLLLPFGVVSNTVRMGDVTAKGYERVWLERAFAAYIPPSNPSQRHNTDEMGATSDFLSVTKEKCDGYEKCKKPNNDGHCDVVTDKKAKNGSEEKKTTLLGGGKST
jgi:putative DNA primase/helicase